MKISSCYCKRTTKDKSFFFFLRKLNEQYTSEILLYLFMLRRWVHNFTCADVATLTTVQTLMLWLQVLWIQILTRPPSVWDAMFGAHRDSHKSQTHGQSAFGYFIYDSCPMQHMYLLSLYFSMWLVLEIILDGTQNSC